jgi:predicted AlkP superfamily pyrophosphatase or phosphodiesterase
MSSHFLMKLILWATFPALLLLAGCVPDDQRTSEGDQQILILISIDGMRHDYQALVETPALDQLTRKGVRAESLTPVFPSKTFPNHYTHVTGLYPENHGIIANRMWDPVFEDEFYIGDQSVPAQDGRWYGGEPLWVTAEKNGLTAASCFWPGSEAEIKGVRPTHFKPYDSSLPYRERIDIVSGWLRMAPDERPRFITLYFESVDGAGHNTGVATIDVMREIEKVDRHIGDLLDNINEMGLEDNVNIIVVSDHGMSQLSRERVIFLDDYIDMADVDMRNYSPVADMTPAAGKEDLVYQQLHDAHPHMAVYRKGEVPMDLHYNNHRRIQPITCIADIGWAITTRGYFESRPNAFTGGSHGYTSDNEEMGGIFVAAGPAFARGKTVISFESVHLYALMCHILNMEPAENDGTLEEIEFVLKGE